MVAIRVELKAGPVGRMMGLMDSGADRTIFPAEALVGAGVVFDQLKPDGVGIGAGGTFETRLCEGSVYFRDWCFATEFQVAEAGHLQQVLLGRADFFRTFVVRFMWQKAPPEIDIDPIASVKLAVAPAKSARRRKK